MDEKDEKPEAIFIEDVRFGGSETASTDASSAHVVVEWTAGRQEWFMLLVVAFVSVMVALDAAILCCALPTIAASLHSSTTETFWIGTSYMLVSAVFMPFMGALSNILGRREVILACILFFTLGSVLTSVAHNAAVMLAGRCFQGVGGAGLVPMANILLCDMVPLRQRPKYLSINQLAWALGTIAGPIVGGALAEHANWRWIFYLNFPFCGIGLAAVPFFVRLRTKESTWAVKLVRVDWFGSALFIASTTSFLVAITWGGVNYAWNSPATLVPLLLGLAGMVATAAWERWGAADPFIRMAIFVNASAILGYVCAILQGMLIFSQIYYLPFFFLTAKRYSPTRTGVSILTLSSTLLPASIVVSVLITRLGSMRWALWSGWACQIAACGLFTLLSADMPTYQWALIIVVAGLGHGILLQALAFVPQAMASASDASYAAVMYVFTRTLGSTLGIAVGGTVFQNMLQLHLRRAALDPGLAQQAEALADVLPKLAPAAQAVLVDAFVQSFRNLFQVFLGVAVLGGFLSLFVKRASLDKDIDSEHALAPRPSDERPWLDDKPSMQPHHAV